MRGCRYDAGSRLPIAAPPDKPALVRAKANPEYVELAVRSSFSFLRGGSSPESLVRRAAELGYEAIALTDYAGLYGIVRAMVENEEIGGGGRLIVGCELPISRTDETVLLHVASQEGYAHLCALLSAAHSIEDPPQAGRQPEGHSSEDPPQAGRQPEGHSSDVERLATKAKGLFCTATASLGRPALGVLHEAFGDRFSLGIHRHLDGEDARREGRTLSASRELGVPIVAHNAVRIAVAEHKPVLDVLHSRHHARRCGARALAQRRESPLVAGRHVQTLRGPPGLDRADARDRLSVPVLDARAQIQIPLRGSSG